MNWKMLMYWSTLTPSASSAWSSMEMPVDMRPAPEAVDAQRAEHQAQPAGDLPQRASG